MKKVYLIHGWGGDSKLRLFGWIKEKLKEKAEIYAFNMPNTNEPKINEWVDFLKNKIKKVDEETYFIGHSIGCQTIMRFLERLEEKVKVAGCIFVAGWFNLKNLEGAEQEIAKPWLEIPINAKKIKEHTKNFLAIFSDNDPYVPLSDSKLFKEKFNAQIIIKKNEEHFDNTTEIKEILDFIK